MARQYVCVALAALLLLGVSTISTSQGPKGKEHQRASRIPSQFSQEERVTMKETLKGVIRIPTVSLNPGEFNRTAMAEFGEYLYKAFPTVFQTSFIRHEVVGEYSHLLTVQGSDPSLQPYMLLAHFDVVPASDQGWEVPPFSGLERDGFIYGRGTLDNKNSVMVSGAGGAQKISALLQERGVQLAFIVDEGGFILDGFIPSFTKPVAMVSVWEKGLLNLMLQVNTTPGHSSTPPKETSIGILAAAVSRLEQTPMPNMFGSGPLVMTLQQLANEFPFPTNIVMKNLWLFRPFVSRSLERSPVTNALIRTTTAVTVFHAGVKVNVIPPLAQAIVNFRIHPAQTGQEVLELAKNIVADDRVQFHVLDIFDPLPASPSDDQALGYQLIRQTLQSVFPKVDIVVPGICVGITDSRHYSNLTTGIYRFNPLSLQPQDSLGIHGINEKISVQGYETQVKFIFEFIQNADADQKPVPHLHEL
ncbi:N-fatty-acyl-amino acid synthase/hydrolase PM20D1 isoform X2 [Desmodus rotundus]|uniref:N-fatty-acyl-amino acid synthase/hydrolase PM20D1 isoform X2 n=1 Tax=Desmodus rotundus TaxID=9430 RepID=UPI002380FAF1|nr:N-fatty-acyl-amino acid synthase/hydrolase PM20D1 isoform X2 [Desmodus rotundus]